MIGVKFNQKVLNDLFEDRIAQVFKILYLFEDKDQEGYKHVQKTINELNGLAYVIPEIASDYRFILLLAKLEFLYDEMLFLDSSHRVIKNTVMESCNLLEKIREGL